MSQYLCEHLDWDSRFFGRRIARLNGPRLDQTRQDDPLKDALDWCAAERVDCLYLLAESDDAATVELARRHGFALTDVRITFERTWREQASPASFIRPAQPQDLPALKAIARASHTDTRFYYDSHFPRDLCDALYETWIENSCNGFAQAVLVAEHNQTACGYVTCHLHNDGPTHEAQLGLIAVAEAQRGRGFGKALTHAFIHWAAQQGAARMTVVTQGRNIAAQRLYQQHGFLTQSLQLWFHYWRCTDSA